MSDLETLNILTTREEFFKPILNQNYSIVINQDIDEYEYNIIDYENAPDFDEDFIITKCLYFTDKVGSIDKKNFSKIKPDCYTCVGLEELPQKIDRFVSFNKEEKLSSGETVLSKKIRTTKDLQDLFDQAEKEVNFTSESLKQRFLLILNEMASNTLYNAPVDENGTPLFRHTNRSEDIKLDDGKEVVVEIKENEHEFAINCKDYYGSLFAQTIKNHLFRELITPRKNESGGAGIGFSLILENCNALHCKIDLNESTEVTVIIKKFKRNKEYLLSSKEVFLSEKGSF